MLFVPMSLKFKMEPLEWKLFYFDYGRNCTEPQIFISIWKLPVMDISGINSYIPFYITERDAMLHAPLTKQYLAPVGSTGASEHYPYFERCEKQIKTSNSSFHFLWTEQFRARRCRDNLLPLYPIKRAKWPTSGELVAWPSTTNTRLTKCSVSSLFSRPLESNNFQRSNLSCLS